MIELTVLSGPNLNREYTTPRVKAFRKEDVQIVGGHGNNAIIRDISRRSNPTYMVGETVAQVQFLTSIATQRRVNMLQTVSANGTTQAAATTLTQFMCEVTTASASNNSVKTMKAVELDISYLVVNATTVTVKVFPASGDRFNNLAVDTAIEILPCQTATFIVKGIS